MKKRIALCLVCLFLLSACAAPQQTERTDVTILTEPQDTEPSSAPSESAPTDADTFGLPYLPAYGFNPFTCNATVNRALFSLLYESLFAVTNQFRAEPVLCESFRVSDEGMTYTFTLLPGVRFSDGTALTAADVAASIEAAQGSELYASRLSHLSSCTANEDGTLTVRLDTAYENFALMLDIPIVKAKTAENSIPIGTGPYRVSGASLVQNEYWLQTQTPVFRQLMLPLTACDSAVSLRDDFEFGSVDMVYCDPNSPAAVDYRCDYEAWAAPTTILHYIGFNLSDGYFSNASLRAAITYAIDRETICGNLYGGFALASPLPCSPNSDLYDRPLAAEYAYDPAKLTAAIRDSGIIANYVGYEGVFLVCAEDPTRVAAAEFIADALTQAGLNLKVSALSRADYRAALQAGNYDLYYGEARLTANFDLSEFFSSSGDLQYGGISDATLLTLCSEALENSGSYVELCAQMLQKAPICPVLFKSCAVYVTRGKLSNLTPGVDLVFHTAGNHRTLSDADQTYADPAPTEDTGGESTPPPEETEEDSSRSTEESAVESSASSAAP